jgi:hypothetical protein
MVSHRVFPLTLAALLASFTGACKGKKPAPAEPEGPSEDNAVPREEVEHRIPKLPEGPDEDALPEARGLSAERRAIQFSKGKEHMVDAEIARARGLVVVDLSDDWAPFLFRDAHAPDGTLLVNRYRSVFVGLANDRTDGDGRALEPGEKNLLELYGIPPSLSVLRTRFLEDEGRDCSDVNHDVLGAVRELAAYGDQTARERRLAYEKRKARVDKAFTASGTFADLDALALAEPKHRADVEAVKSYEAERAAFAEVEKRMICEGRVDPAKHVAGTFDTSMRRAVVAFQQENALLDRSDMSRETLNALTRSVGANNLAALRRAIAERAVDAAGILEDGSVRPPAKKDGSARKVPTYETESGERVEVPDLVTPATDAVLARMGISTPEDALAFFKRHAAADFKWLKVAARFPTLPEYYSDHMDLSVEIDRGDIWYEFPYDAKGNKVPQPRRYLPTQTLFVSWRGERVPLIKWRTTIGGWRTEMASDGQDYLRYKGSDVGPRVWQHVVAAPVWIPPESTPLGGMVQKVYVNGRRQWATNYDELGPGYLSAYGLAMAIHVEVRRHKDGRVTYFDNGIRSHGSSDYRSLLGRFSHGCHRLYNNLAVRLFSFVLRHRHERTMGQVTLDFRRTFFKDDKIFDLRLPVRGFYYLLDPPLPVEVLEGNIKGKLKDPVEVYVKKPWETYPNERPPPVLGGPESKAGGAAPATDPGEES